jgi:hypothetical protein
MIFLARKGKKSNFSQDICGIGSLLCGAGPLLFSDWDVSV